MKLVRPSVLYQDSFLRALSAYQDEGRHLDLDGERLARRFETYVDELLARADPATLRPEGRVPETTLWYVEESEFLGRVSIRHCLTPQLRKVGGHIGYDVAPAVRGRGHATRMLAEALPCAFELGIDPALITCDADNVASRKVIEANGGVLHDEGSTLRFWVKTSNGNRRNPGPGVRS